MPKKKKSGYYTRMLKICRQQWSRNNAERKACFVNARSISVNKVTKWVCKDCKGLFALSEVECDHIEPIRNTVPETKEEFFECFTRLHAPAEGLQILCKPCHKLKTKAEVSGRARVTQIEYAATYLRIFGYPLTVLESISDTHLKRLVTIIKSINKSENNARSNWRTKLFMFMKDHG